jgi:hypothetical protein
MYREFSPITIYLRKKLKIFIKDVYLCNKDIQKVELYRFTQGKIRYPKIEKELLKLGVPQDTIDETFSLYKSKQEAKK